MMSAPVSKKTALALPSEPLRLPATNYPGTCS